MLIAYCILRNVFDNIGEHDEISEIICTMDLNGKTHGSK